MLPKQFIVPLKLLNIPVGQMFDNVSNLKPSTESVLAILAICLISGSYQNMQFRTSFLAVTSLNHSVNFCETSI